MIKCPFCHFENEDGALFCERCTSDLSAVAPTPASPPPAPAIPPALPAIPVAEAMPLIAEAVPFEGMSPFEAIPVASAEPLEAVPMAPLEGVPLSPFEALAQPIELTPVQPAALEHVPPPPHVPAVEPLSAAPLVTPAPMPAPTPAPAPAPAAPEPSAASSSSQPRLLVQRGQRRNVEYPIYEGLNFIGRADEKPVDIDLEEQEPADRIWCSRQHACITWENDVLTLEDLNSANGTYVNRTRVYPGQKKQLVPNDIIQIGNVQLKVVI